MKKKNSNPVGALKRTGAYMSSSMGIIIFALVLAALSAVMTIIGPDKIGKMATIMSDGLFTGIDLAAIAKIGVFLAIIYCLSALFGFIQHYIMAVVTLKMSYRMRGELSEKINRVPQKYFNTTSQGDILSRITNDVSTLQQGLTNSLPTIISAATQFVGCLIMMFVTEWRMALVALCITLLGMVLIVAIMSKSQRYFTARQKSLGELNGYVEEMYSGHEVVRISRAVDKVLDHFDGLNAAVYDANWRSQFLSGVMQPLMNVIGNLAYVAVCVFGSVLAINGTIEFGVIVSFILYVRLFTTPLTQIAQGMTNLQTASASAHRIFDFLESEELGDESDKTEKLDAVRGALSQSCRALTPPLDPDTLAETLPALRAAAARDAEALAAQHTAQQQALSALQALEAGLPAQEEALRRQQADIQERAQELSARAARCAELDAEAERRAQELPHENRAAAQRALVETRTQCEALQQALDTARERSSAAQSVLAALTGKRDALRAQIQAAPPADIAALRTRRDALTVRAEQLQRQISTCDARLEQNRAARTAIDTRRQQHAAVRARWQWVHALAATANGAVPGKEKIMLETYIQTAYFDRILGRANTRLLIMSGGQYELRRCARAGDNRSQTGLELEVIDHYNGTARSVKTLSGGETFAASLSLALGLSDEVQATAGGVQLEAMFVDEGFGSLDSEALQQALAALVGVSGGSRIVGIISHVAELKDRIDRQIIVTKDRSGGSRVQVQA